MDGNAPTSAEDLSPECVERYRREGFVHVPGVLTPAEVEEFRTGGTELLGQDDKTHWGDRSGTVLDFVEHAQLRSAAMLRLALHPRVASLAERLAGTSLRLFKLELLRKGTGRSKPTEPHFDAFALPVDEAPATLTAWVALVDVPVERGCMTFVPGSHLLPPPEVTAHAWAAYDRPEVAWLPRVTVPLRAGDCTFHHARTVHAAGANASDAPRISATTVYADAGAVYRPTGNQGLDELPGAGLLVPGQRLDDDRFPLLSPGVHRPAD
ncbi:hypothetical protein HEK616_47270 [Streptomyces nigrescens]|uniref:Phytanoyl-CoA dioxygenase n=1 Tax=Streptomyces nigrescens TaxID=1920 RepID=A0ABN6R2F1_STRNI|nr:hypothetical protein HEK616_47270 [Streptomyces nigrescens]